MSDYPTPPPKKIVTRSIAHQEALMNFKSTPIFVSNMYPITTQVGVVIFSFTLITCLFFLSRVILNIQTLEGVQFYINEG